MFKSFPNIIFALIIFALLGCSSKNERIGTFKITKFTIDETLYKNTKDSLNYQDLDNLCNSYLNETYIKFYDKDTVSLLSSNGRFTYGDYMFKTNDNLKIELKKIGTFDFNVKEEITESGDLEYLVLTGINEKNIVVKLILKKDDYYDYEKFDLLGVKENLWRLKSSKNESDTQIRQRIVSQMSYMKSYFEFIEDKKYTTFQITQLYSPYKFYANGLGIDLYSADEYAKIFHDQSDADKALEIAGEALRSLNKYPSDPKSYTAGYKNAIVEILRYLKIN